MQEVVLLYKNQPTRIGKLIVVQGNQLTAMSIRRTLQRTMLINNVPRALHRTLQGAGWAAVEYTCP